MMPSNSDRLAFLVASLVFYIIAIPLLLVGFIIPASGVVEYGAAFIIGGLLMEFVGKYINRENEK